MVQLTNQTSGDYCCGRSAAKQQGKRTTARTPLQPVFTVDYSAACNANEKQFCKNEITIGSTEILLTSNPKQTRRNRYQGNAAENRI